MRRAEAPSAAPAAAALTVVVAGWPHTGRLFAAAGTA